MDGSQLISVSSKGSKSESEFVLGYWLGYRPLHPHPLPSRELYLCLGGGLTLRVSDWCPYGKYAQGESSVQWRYPGANIAVIKYAPRVVMEQDRTRSFIHILIPTPSLVMGIFDD